MDSFTKIPNWFFSELMREDLNGSEFQTYLCIIRHTYGYHKDTAELSAYTIARETGLYVRSVERALSSLRKKKLIKTKTKMQKNMMYEPNKITILKRAKTTDKIDGDTTDKIDGDTTDKIDAKPPSKLTDIKENIKASYKDMPLGESILVEKKEKSFAELNAEFDGEDYDE